MKNSKIFNKCIAFVLCGITAFSGVFCLPAHAEPAAETTADTEATSAESQSEPAYTVDTDIETDWPSIDLEDDDIETGLVVKMGVVNGTDGAGVYIREYPSANSDIVYGVAEETELLIISHEGNWYKVGYYGFVGYAFADYIVPYSTGSCEFGCGTVTGTCVNLRYKPSLESDILCSLVEGTSVRIIGARNGWYKIDYNGIEGYIHADYLYPIKDETVNFKYAKVNTIGGANIRKSTSADLSESLKLLSYGTEVKVLSILNGWYKIQYDNLEGYIREDLLINSANFVDARSGGGSSGGGGGSAGGSIGNSYSSEGARIVAYGKQFLGYPYVWGGYLPSTGFDCSGFTQYIFGQCGYTLNYRTQQYRNGTAVKYANLQIGDLVFFDTNENGTIGHVGVYAGNGTFLHAANPKRGVIISDMSPGSYYYNIYVCARRIV